MKSTIPFTWIGAVAILFHFHVIAEPLVTPDADPMPEGPLHDPAT